MSINPVRFDLINNAKDSLRHAVKHLTEPGGPAPEDLKYAIRDVAHVVELLLKERLRREHDVFVYQHIDKYKSKDAKTIDTGTAITRLLMLCNVRLSDADKNTIEACRSIRNDIEHYQFTMDIKAARGVIGRMLSFIFGFSREYLDLNLEAEFKKDDSWKALIDIYEFWEAHGKTLEAQLVEKDIPYCDCPACSAGTFDLEAMQCLLCGHRDQEVECESCHDTVWESEVETFDEEDRSFTICKDCIESMRADQEY